MAPGSLLIHPAAAIHPSARLGRNVAVAAFAVVGAEVEIGDDTRIGPHTVIEGPTKIGRGNVFLGHGVLRVVDVHAEDERVQVGGLLDSRACPDPARAAE